MVYAAAATGGDEESKQADGRSKHLPSCAQAHRRRGAIKVRNANPVFLVTDCLPACVFFVSTHVETTEQHQFLADSPPTSLPVATECAGVSGSSQIDNFSKFPVS